MHKSGYLSHKKTCLSHRIVIYIVDKSRLASYYYYYYLLTFDRPISRTNTQFVGGNSRRTTYVLFFNKSPCLSSLQKEVGGRLSGS